jgi:hypothetical protein
MRRRGYKRQKGSPFFLLVGLGLSIAAYVYLGHPAIALISAVVFGLLVCWNQDIGLLGMGMALIAGLIVVAATSPEFDPRYNADVLGGVILCIVCIYGLKYMVFGGGSEEKAL